MNEPELQTDCSLVYDRSELLNHGFYKPAAYNFDQGKESCHTTKEFSA